MPNKVTVEGPTILLRSGTYFSLLHPEFSDFTIEDIAHGLAHICRFTGQVDKFYSVAEHCVIASRHVPKHHAFATLMHDAAEAFIGDVSKPLKEMLPNYKEVEKRVERAVMTRFGINMNLHEKVVKEVDMRMLVTEQRQLLRNSDTWTWAEGQQPLDVQLKCWSPKKAKRKFLERFEELWL